MASSAEKKTDLGYVRQRKIRDKRDTQEERKSTATPKQQQCNKENWKEIY